MRLFFSRSSTFLSRRMRYSIITGGGVSNHYGKFGILHWNWAKMLRTLTSLQWTSRTNVHQKPCFLGLGCSWVTPFHVHGRPVALVISWSDGNNDLTVSYWFKIIISGALTHLAVGFVGSYWVDYLFCSQFWFKGIICSVFKMLNWNLIVRIECKIGVN